MNESSPAVQDVERRQRAALNTPTDLQRSATRDVAAGLNAILADVFALYLKTKNFHWHLSGSHFRDYHLLFDEQAEQILDSVDILAERGRKLSGTTIRSISHVSALQTIADDNEEFVTPGEMVRRLMADNGQMVAAQRAAHEVCDKNRDYATASLVEVIIDETECRKWFLFEITQGMDNTN